MTTADDEPKTQTPTEQGSNTSYYAMERAMVDAVKAMGASELRRALLKYIVQADVNANRKLAPFLGVKRDQ